MQDLVALVTAAPETPAGTSRFVRWLSLQGLSIVLWVLGALLATRFIQWVVGRITARIDSQFTESDALVRSEAIKHRHSVAQILAWAAIAIVYIIAGFNIVRQFNVPITGFVAPATVLGAALGFGAQRIVQDLLSGFFIITEKQYGFGDVVSLAIVGATEPAEGTVEDVTLRITKLRSADGQGHQPVEGLGAVGGGHPVADRCRHEQGERPHRPDRAPGIHGLAHPQSAAR